MNNLLVNNPILGYAYHEIILDETGKPCNYRFLKVNSTFEKLTGLQQEDILNKTVTEVIPNIKESKFNWINYYGNIALNGGKSEFEQYSEALEKWYRVYVYSTEKMKFSTIFVDITETKKQQEEFEIFFSLSLDMVCVCKENGDLLKVNNTWTEFLGFSQNETLSKNIVEFIHHDDRNRVRDIISSLKNHQSKFVFSCVCLTKNNEYKDLEWRILKENDKLYAVAKDISDYKKVEKSLRKTVDRLELVIKGIDDGIWDWDLESNDSRFLG